MITIDIWIFGNSGWEMDLKVREIKELGENIINRLGRTMRRK